MVDVVVAMAILTMNEQSFISLHKILQNLK